MYVKILKTTLGITLIAIGVAGLFVPLVPGILLLLAGFLIFGIKKEHLKEWFSKLKF